MLTLIEVCVLWSLPPGLMATFGAGNQPDDVVCAPCGLNVEIDLSRLTTYHSQIHFSVKSSDPITFRPFHKGTFSYVATYNLHASQATIKFYSCEPTHTWYLENNGQQALPSPWSRLQPSTARYPSGFLHLAQYYSFECAVSASPQPDRVSVRTG